MMPGLPFGPGCPWYALNAAHPPNLDWCEAKLCNVIVTPFNSWTNLAYLVVALLMLAVARPSGRPTLRMFPLAVAITGIASFVYHMSLNFYTQLVDFAGMYVFCMLILVANLQRMGRWVVGARSFGYYWLAVGTLTAMSAITLRAGLPAQGFVALLIALIVWSELAQPAAARGYFWLGLTAMVVASALSALDLARIVCVPANHWFQGHGLWHVLTALAIYLVFLHLRQVWRE